MNLITSSQDDLLRLVEAAGEQVRIDAKGPMMWDGKESSASLTKDILAFANTRDGGVLVIGKTDNGDGTFGYEGLSQEQWSTFDTTDVAKFVNGRCAPHVELTCNPVSRDGKTFVVIIVKDFDDVPVICVKSYQSEIGNKSFILREGDVYVRTKNVESVKITKLDDWRTLIGLATTKQADLMLSRFNAMLKGRPLIEPVPPAEQFRDELLEVESLLANQMQAKTEDGGWVFVCFPADKVPDRWDDTNQLKDNVSRSVVDVRRTFPLHNSKTHAINWGIWNQFAEDAFGLTRSALLVIVRMFRENSMSFGDGRIPPGHWLDYKSNLATVIEFFVFLSRYADNFDAGEKIIVDIRAQGISGRWLCSMDREITITTTGPCISPSFRYTKVLSIEECKVNWEEYCVKVLTKLFELFEGVDIPEDAYRIWINRFKNRRFLN